MAKLGVAGGGALLGAAIGSFIPGGTLLGAQIGFALGGVAGALLFPDSADGPRLNDSTLQTSGYGVPIPVVAARAKLAGNVIWADALREQKKRKRGKGGSNTNDYTYTRSFAVGFCEWLLPPSRAALLKLWLDEKLIYDATGDSETVSVGTLTWRFYGGTETQTPDPLIEAALGDDAPAFRGMVYLVFEHLPLDPFGQRMPNVTVEIAGETSPDFPQVNSVPPTSPLYPSRPSRNAYMGEWGCNVAVDYARGRIYEARTRTTGNMHVGNDELIRVYDLATMQTLGEYPMGDMVRHLFPTGSPTDASVGAGIMHLGVDGYLYCTGGAVTRVPLWKIDPDSWIAVGVFGNPAGNGFGIGDYGAWLFCPMQIRTVADAAGTSVSVVVQGTRSVIVIDAATMTYVWGASDDAPQAPDPIAVGLSIAPLSFPIVLCPGATGELWYLRASELDAPPRVDIKRLVINGLAVSVSDYAPIDCVAEIDSAITRPLMQAAYYDESDRTLVAVISGAGSPLNWSRFSAFKWSPRSGVVWVQNGLPLPPGHDARGEQRRVLGGKWGLGGNFVLETAGGTPLVEIIGAPFNSLFWLDEREAQIGYVKADRGPWEIAKRYLTRVAADTLTVGDVVGALCERAGLDPSDYDVTDLTDSLRGYMLGSPMDARAAIQVLATAYQFDAAEIDDVLVFVRRGGGAVATIPYDDLVREDPDAAVLEEQRAQDAELPREVNIRFADFYRGWEQGAQSWRRAISPTPTMTSRGSISLDLPVPISADEAKTIARRVCTALWRERSTLSFSVGQMHARIVPTDVVTVGTRDGATLRCRVVSVQDGANWVRRIEAVADDAAVYTLTTEADNGGYWDAPTIPGPYFTRLLLPDLALVEDGDDMGQSGIREYALCCAYDEHAWRGVKFYRRQPRQDVWVELGVSTDPVPWGAVVAMPAPPPSPWTWDEDGALVVRMTAGEPESATALEVLDWANVAALIAPDGTAEIIQFRTATDEGGGLFRLTGLLRGRRGTEDLIASRIAGHLFVLLDDTRLEFAAAPSDAATAVERLYRVAGLGETVKTVPVTVTKDRRGRAEMPYAPVQITGSRDGANNLTLAWVRRTRVGGDWLGGTGAVPLSEASEAYEVDILDGGAVVRTITGLSSPSATYSAANQTADGLTPGDPVRVRIFQISAIVGRGVAGEATI